MPNTTARIQLTPSQRDRTEIAREALHASEADKDTGNFSYHLGCLEVALTGALRVIDELTGGGQ